MTKEEMREILSTCLETEVDHVDPPSEMDWERLEKKFNCEFPTEFKWFIEFMSVFSFPGDILNVSSGITNGNDHIEFTFDYEMEHGQWNANMIPFYSIGNGDYFCISAADGLNTSVYYFYHEKGKEEKYVNRFEDWIKDLPKFLG